MRLLGVAAWILGAFIPLPTAPTPRFKQLLLTQADKFSLAEVRGFLAPSWGAHPAGPWEASGT